MNSRSLFFFLATLSGATAFAPSQVSRPLTSLANDPAPPGALEYPEESRKYRRTVFTHDDWVKHRSPDRFLRNLSNFANSGVYKNIGREVTAATGMACLVLAMNALTGTYEDFSGVSHAGPYQGMFPKAVLPMSAFTLVSPSLGLLLVFRTNTAYQRWDEARKNWGLNINRTRDLVRMGTSFYDQEGVSDEERNEDLQHLSKCTWAFVRSMKRHLSPAWDDEDEFQAELKEKLPEEQAEAIIAAAHRPNRALYDLSLAIENLPMHYLRKNQMHTSLTQFEDNLGSSERLLTSPVPLFYSRHLARFLSVWLLLLPFALYGNFEGNWNHVGLVPTVSVISLFLFGIEELAAQMEEPFTILPMQAFCDKIGNWCNEIVSWSPGDNGFQVKEPYAKHVTMYDTEITKGTKKMFKEAQSAKTGKALPSTAQAKSVNQFINQDKADASPRGRLRLFG